MSTIIRNTTLRGYSIEQSIKILKRQVKDLQDLQKCLRAIGRVHSIISSGLPGLPKDINVGNLEPDQISFRISIPFARCYLEIGCSPSAMGRGDCWGECSLNNRDGMRMYRRDDPLNKGYEIFSSKAELVKEICRIADIASNDQINDEYEL